MRSSLRVQRLLRWYPRAWRDRYGDEFAALLEEQCAGRRPPLRLRLDVVRGGSVQRLRASGLVGDALPPAEQARAGVLSVAVAWTVFVFAGCVFAKYAEHWQDGVSSGRAGVPRVAFWLVQLLALVVSAVVLVGIAAATPAAWRMLRSGGWIELRRPVLRAVLVSAVTLMVTVFVFARAHQITATMRDGGYWPYALLVSVWAVFVAAAMGWWCYAGIAVGRRVELSERLLRFERVIVAVACAGMVVMTVSTVVWWIALAGAAPGFFAVSAGLVPSPTMTVVIVLMAVASAGAAVATVRASVGIARLSSQ